jgi:eukaryotic-like serine/threonine-protein kinase
LTAPPTAGPMEARAMPLAAGHVSAAHAALALPKPGDVVAGKYRIEKVVGEGGMGIVYAAHHLVLDQRVALKLLLLDALQGDETVERFVREAQAAARLRSEHVVRVTDAGALDSGLPFLVMEFLQGCDLAELLALDGSLPSSDTADYMLQALAALALAHAAGIIHRDLKPANFFLAIRDDGSNILKILDFGISKQQSTKAQWKELTGKAVLGTPAYMSPEQLRSSKNVDARADIWSLGVVMYELLTGRMPFDGEGPGEVFAAILEKTPVPLRQHRSELSQVWEDVVMRCLLRDPGARFQDVGALAHALAPLASARWKHLPGAVVQAVAGPVRSLAKEGIALVDAAVAAAVTSLPPPMMRLPLSGRESPNATFVTNKTMVAEVPPPHAATSRRRLPVAAAAAFATVLMVLGLAVGRRGVSNPSSHAAAARPVATTQATISAPEPPAEPAVALPALPAVEPVAAPPASAPEAVAATPKPALPLRRSAASAPRTPAVAARPAFLKSWR